MTIPHDTDNLRDRLAEALGWKAYNRLVESVSDTRRRGRLRFWQEQLLQQAGPTGEAMSTTEEFLRVLDGATLRPVPCEPWTREAFLHRIEEWPHIGFLLDETPPEWMAAAWELDRVREELSGDMARTVSKTGQLAYTDEYLRYLSISLPVQRQVELFLYIRERCVTREEEFRPGFEQSFPDCVPALPPPLTHQQLLHELGITEEEYQRQFSGRTQPSSTPDDPNQDSWDEIPF